MRLRRDPGGYDYDFTPPRDAFKTWVPGVPQAKGNMGWNHKARKMYDKGGVPLETWMDSLVLMVTARRAPRFPTGVPVTVNRYYLLPRPKEHYGTGRNAGILRPKFADVTAHTTKPDLDKLDRAVFDSLTRAGVVADDGQIIGGFHAKDYATHPRQPGVLLTIWGQS